MKPGRILLFGLIFSLVACSTPQASTPGPTPEAIRLIYPAALQPWADRLAGCSASESQLALYFSQSSQSGAIRNTGDIQLTLGQPSNVEPHELFFQVGWEQVVVIVSQDNPMSKLSDDQLRQIYSGQLQNWPDRTNQPIQVWVMPQDDPIRQIFDQALQTSQPTAPEARLAPDPAALLEAVATDDNAIGYLPKSFLTTANSGIASQVKALKLDATTEHALNQPVIASTMEEPVGQVRNLLLCLQGQD